MRVFITEYDRKWIINAVDSKTLRRLGRKHPYKSDDLYTYYNPAFGHYGPIWRGSQIFISYEAAEKYIRKEYVPPELIWEGQDG